MRSPSACDGRISTDATERDPWIQSLYPEPSRTRGRRKRWYGSVSRSSVGGDSRIHGDGGVSLSAQIERAAGVGTRSQLGGFGGMVGEKSRSAECAGKGCIVVVRRRDIASHI